MPVKADSSGITVTRRASMCPKSGFQTNLGHKKSQHVPEVRLSNEFRSQEEPACARSQAFKRISVTRRASMCPKSGFQMNFGHKKSQHVPEVFLSNVSRSQEGPACARSQAFKRISVTRRASMCPKSGFQMNFGHKKSQYETEI